MFIVAITAIIKAIIAHVLITGGICAAAAILIVLIISYLAGKKHD